jgi:hypothetical protein
MDDIKAVTSSLDVDARLLLLARLIYELTVPAREGYAGVTAHSDNPAILRGINELIHPLASELAQALRGAALYGDAVFDIVRDSARASHVDGLLANAWDRALARVREVEGKQ